MLSLLLLPCAWGVMMEVIHDQVRCIAEDLDSGIKLTGSFTVTPFGRSVDFNVTDPSRLELVNRLEVTKGSFDLQTKNAGDHIICFKNHNNYHNDPTSRDDHTIVDLKLTFGAAAVRFRDDGTEDSIADRISTLNEVSKQILSDISQIRTKEQVTSDLEARTLKQIRRTSILSIIVILSVAIWEMFYLRRFFIQQKVA
ncbi:putative emp24/gp25L/p24 family/GOLD [Blattamonas nauphoetae]|uniref:Emp24/gp25L/p24 family/GOLD n=1 Tax=Blattamonas nauphoetae TaxID=2049346 RepID=A0ABQ9XPW5_9EUKA|nr:putative emp24/gp25L/p24 family/GOLD [Blattamonas nauphoetae]